MPKTEPMLIEVPSILYIMVDGVGNPNECQAYQDACEMLYGLSYGIKMSKMKGNKPAGYFEYVVPPLEGLWTVLGDSYAGTEPVKDKSKFKWTSMIRQPEFVTYEVFEEAKKTLHAKKPNLDLSLARLVDWEEGLCAQVMHIGTFDEEVATVKKLEEFIIEQGYKNDISNVRQHHEIYMSDPRKCKPEKMQSVIRHPIALG